MNEPEDKENLRLEQFAQRLSESLPELSGEAMQRIEQAMHGEVQRVQRRQRLVKLSSVAALAAALLVAVGIWALQHRAGPPKVPAPENEIALPDDPGGITPVVEDRFVVVVALPDNVTSDTPLVRLEDYRSLIDDVN